MKLRAIGFWRSERDETPTLPDPRDFLDPEWSADERRCVVGYLRDARRVRYFMGPSRCRRCGVLLGNAEHGDGTYLWPEGFAHYLDEHSVRPPEEFLDHVWRQLEREDAIESDREWWAKVGPTGTARAWTRLRIELAGEASAADAWSPVSAAREPVLEPVWRELRERGVAYVPDSELGHAVRTLVEERGVPWRITIERVAAPDRLQA